MLFFPSKEKASRMTQYLLGLYLLARFADIRWRGKRYSKTVITCTLFLNTCWETLAKTFTPTRACPIYLLTGSSWGVHSLPHLSRDDLHTDQTSCSRKVLLCLRSRDIYARNHGIYPALCNLTLALSCGLGFWGRLPRNVLAPRWGTLRPPPGSTFVGRILHQEDPAGAQRYEHPAEQEGGGGAPGAGGEAAAAPQLHPAALRARRS